MRALTPQRSSPCLLCAFASRRAPALLRPRVQVAHRTSTAKATSLSRARADPTHRGPSSFNTGRPPIRYSARGLPPRASAEQIQEHIKGRLEFIRRDLEEPAFLASLRLDQPTFRVAWDKFTRNLANVSNARFVGDAALLRMDAQKGNRELDQRIKHLFYAEQLAGRFTQAEMDNQKDLADLRYPGEWYPATREIKRTVHLHVGPTNSGKTYHALKRLEEAESGIYLGPLRLLAHEVYTRLNAKGKSCALVTGDDQRIPEGGHSMWSCTVEMAPLNTRMDVAVIDEIQMINNEDRGWAWTQAFLGIQANEVHLCGEARTVTIIRELCALTGDDVVEHHYERLSPLQVADRSLYGDLSRLEKGDCVVAFTVLGLHALRREIERKTNRKCAIVYGSLPPETRAQQAKLFNDPDNDYDFLVASDAIGMGLNLSIKRIIFDAVSKFNGVEQQTLKISELKQIGGRAGRYKSAHDAIKEDSSSQAIATGAGDPTMGLDDTQPEVAVEQSQAEEQSVGYVTTLEPYDFKFLQRNFQLEPEPIKAAGLFPPALITERFSNYFPPGTPFSHILLRLHEISNVHQRFFLCGLKDQLTIADVIQPVQNLTTTDRLQLCAAPASCREPMERKFLLGLAECIAENKSGALLDVPDLPLEILEVPMSAEREYLRSLEALHKLLVLYLWLSYRFPNVFTTRSLAYHAKQLVEEKIETTLITYTHTDERRQREKQLRKAWMEKAEHVKNSFSSDSLDATEKRKPSASADSTIQEGEALPQEHQRQPKRLAERVEGETSALPSGAVFGTDHKDVDQPRT